MVNMTELLEKTIYPVLAPQLVEVLRQIPFAVLNEVTEIRLRVRQPLLIIMGSTDAMISPGGQPVADGMAAYHCTNDDIVRTLQMMSRNSLYAFEQEMRLGYLTIGGGHRVGLAGQAILENDCLKMLKNISALNIRLAKEARGCADKVMPYLAEPDGSIYSTLIISPPRCGKTTLLRDIIRQFSYGFQPYRLPGVTVGLVDERSEIAGCQDGIPTVDLGPRADILDGCPKATGMLMLIRSMSPRIIVTDELGRQEDAQAVKEALHAGVSVIASVHGRDVADIACRPYISDLILHKYFDRYVVLTNVPQIGTVEQVIQAKNSDILYTGKKGVRICG